MNVWAWLTGSAPSPVPPPVVEPRLAMPDDVETKQVGVGPGNIVESINAQAFPQRVYYGSNTGIPVTPFSAMQSAAVYGCCKCIAEDIGGLELQIRRRLPGGRGWIVDYDHPLNRLYRQPNRWQTPAQMWNFILFAYSMRGNSYAVIQRDRAGTPIELVPVTPDRVTLRVSPETGLVWYYVQALYVGQGVWLPADDMVHMKNMSFDGYLGLSPIACAQDVIGLTIAAQQHGAVLFRQGGQIGAIFKHPGKLGKEAADRIAQSFRDTHGGVQNAHKAMVLEEGMSFERPGMTNDDAQFLETRQFQVIDICRLFRVPPHKLGELGRATFSNIEQQQQQYIDDCLQPHTIQLEQLLDEDCLFESEREAGYAHHFDYSSMLRGDQLRRFQAYQIGTLNGWLSRNEVRSWEGLNPVPGGDEYRVPLNTANPQQPGLGQRVPGDAARTPDVDDTGGEREVGDEDC